MRRWELMHPMFGEAMGTVSGFAIGSSVPHSSMIANCALFDRAEGFRISTIFLALFDRRSVEIAKEQDARLFELRGAKALASLACNDGRRDDARTMLADIYNWFTEGFDTADLKDAKALLDELNA